MKRLFVVISSLLILPAFAEVAPQYLVDEGTLISDEGDIQQSDAEQPSEVATTNTQSAPSAQPTLNQRASQASRVSPRTTLSRTGTESTSNNPRRAATARATRGVSARTTSTARNSTTDNRQTVARISLQHTPTVATGYSVQNPSSTTTRISSLGGTSASLYNRNSSTRASGVRIATTNITSTNTSTTDNMEDVLELTDYCKAQYAMCMDNYCAVLDDNQARCTCSANVTNYAKTEQALADATEALQEVASQIQYIGLSADDVESLFKETEAELAMSQTTDTTDLKASLDRIKKMIIDVKSGPASSATSGVVTDLSGLLEFTIDSTGFDLSSFMVTNTNTSSISNQRGGNLYKTASARCKASVLNRCTSQGIDASLVTNYYDLQIDKDCLAYERELEEANTNMNATVRNAKAVLQKARLMVKQNKNQYDLRGCVEALDSCMQSDFVCGSEYENCLDPTGKYIVNGNIVIGSMPGDPTNINGALYSKVWSYGDAYNAWADTTSGGSLSDYIKQTIGKDDDTNVMSEYLQSKIGYHDNGDGRDYGMCISVLNQCQNYTYKKNNNKTEYDDENRVIEEYLARTLVQIKSSQDTVLAKYAEDCRSDVTSCLSTNGYNATATQNVKDIAINACKATITTCRSVNGGTDSYSDSELKTWVGYIMGD